jgi:ribosome biogenesis protein SLX9
MAATIHHYGDANQLLGVWWWWVTGLEASRAPYSKSHARRLKRREKEELTAGGLGSLKAALPSIAPTTRTTAATIIGDRSAGELDAAAATAAASMKPINNKLKPKSKSKQPTDQSEVPPPSPTTRPGQIGEGHGAPLMRSQRRRRALYATYFHCQLSFCVLQSTGRRLILC